MPKDAADPFPVGFEPQIDTSSELDEAAASYYHSLIGIVRWMVEIGRVDIGVEVSLLIVNDIVIFSPRFATREPHACFSASHAIPGAASQLQDVL